MRARQAHCWLPYTSYGPTRMSCFEETNPEYRAADAEKQLNDTKEHIAQLTAHDCKLENQCAQLQVQPPAPAAVMQRLTTAGGQVRELQGQLLSANQQLLLSTQQSHKYLQKLMQVRTRMAAATTLPSGAGGLSTLGGKATANASPVFAGSGATLGMFALPQATPPAGVPGQMESQVLPAPQPAPAVTTSGQGTGSSLPQ